MWPSISNIDANIEATIKGYANNNLAASQLNAWIRAYSGANDGLILESNTDFKLFAAAGEGNAIYGSSDRSGIIGKNWDGGDVTSGVGRALRPSPVITTFNSKEGKDQISRTCDFSITCFSLEQLELMQTYFMEPGYSVALEWGWNTANSTRGLIDTSVQKYGILNAIADVTLNNGALAGKRSGTNGEYDIFLGFIIGSTVSNDGENFKVDVKLRGAPSLPTYLQSHNRITTKSSGTTPGTPTADGDKSKILYSDAELVTEGDTDIIAAERRFKAMFNALPAFRQTESVKSLIKSTTINDYINFDPVISKKIGEFANKREGILWGIFGAAEVEVQTAAGTVAVSKEKLFSNNKYIRFGLAVDILNKMGEVDVYVVGGKEVSFKIDINTTIIGAFPYMFSTKASKLAIPGKVPNFRESYFLNPEEVEQYNSGYLLTPGLNDGKPLDPRGLATFSKFVEMEKDLNDFGLKEKKGYYGYLKNLYVNFEMFKEKIEQKNKTIKDILLDILNEMSSAVNSFWNFQIIEGELKKSNEQLANELRERAPYVAAPAFSAGVFNPLGGGYTPGAGFANNTGFGVSGGGTAVGGTVVGGTGVGGAAGAGGAGLGTFGGGFNPGSGISLTSGFLPGTFTGNIGGGATPAERWPLPGFTSGGAGTSNLQKAGDIVLTIIDENWIGEIPDADNIKTFFHSGIGSPFLQSSLDISIPGELANKIILDRLGSTGQTDIKPIKTGTLFNSKIDLFITRVQASGNPVEDTTAAGDAGVTEGDDPAARKTKLIAQEDAKIDENKRESKTDYLAGTTIQKDYDSSGFLIRTTTITTVSTGTVSSTTRSYVYTNSSIGTATPEEVAAVSEAELQATETRISSNIEKVDVVPKPQLKVFPGIAAENIRNEIANSFFVFCFDDTDFFEKMKNYYIGEVKSGSLTQPLPIKYSFTILGNSGIRRGDVFSIYGIPEKYRTNGIFQVTEIEHSMTNMRWETTVTGEYRQIQ
jgi:hypothetical protein